MNKRLVSIMMFGVFLSPNVLAVSSGAGHVVLFEASEEERPSGRAAGRDAGEMTLSEHSGKDAQCAFDANPRHALLERSGDSGAAGRGSRAL
ncbi:MAG: hypothetical protein IT285_08415 [Bdellovibrionales bacterium]|nr:hypothetical protein [Bdellovibrionales bacterium]